MNPLTYPCRSLALIIAAALAVPCARAQDGQPVDIAKMLQQLSQVREQQTTQLKAEKLKILQQVSSAATSNETALALWEEAVRTKKFEGVDKESSAFRDWRENEGPILKERESKMALHLHFAWLAITLQRSTGTPVKELLPAVVAYTKDLWAYENALSEWDDDVKGGKESVPGKGKQVKMDEKLADRIRGVRNEIVGKPVSDGVYLQSLKAGELANVPNWEKTPTQFDGIYDRIVMPECRAQKDQRLLEYWDFRMKRAADAAVHSKRSFDTDNFNTVTMPSLLFRKSLDTAVLGSKNRAATDMFNLIKKYPGHPELSDWARKLEEMLTAAVAPAHPAATAPATGTAPPP